MATQVERSSATREKTIAATIELLVERGYAGATIAAVAERAGVSRGAVSHQYPDKRQLVVDVVDEIARRRTAEAQALLAAAPPGRRRVEVGLDELWRVFKSPIYTAGLEVYVAGRTDPALRPRVLRLEEEIEEALREVIRRMTGLASGERDVDVHADVVINTLRGLAMMYTTGMPVDALERAWAQAKADTARRLTELAEG